MLTIRRPWEGCAAGIARGLSIRVRRGAPGASSPAGVRGAGMGRMRRSSRVESGRAAPVADPAVHSIASRTESDGTAGRRCRTTVETHRLRCRIFEPLGVRVLGFRPRTTVQLDSKIRLIPIMRNPRLRFALRM